MLGKLMFIVVVSCKWQRLMFQYLGTLEFYIWKSLEAVNKVVP